MAPELPGERLQRRLGLLDESHCSTSESLDDDETDPNSLLPRWLPDGAPDAGWIAKVRADPGRAGAIGLALIAVVALLVAASTMFGGQPAPVRSAKLPPVETVPTARTDAPTAASSSDAKDAVVVSVIGLVHKPGLATLPPGSRIADALSAAGGAIDGADTLGLNLARPLVDGEQIVVGLAPPSGPPLLGSSVGTGSPAPRPAPPSAAVSAPPAGSPRPQRSEAGSPSGSGQPVNLNTATAEQLDRLPGVGPVTAAAIVAFREAHGKFASVDQLGDVDGIGPARLDKLRALVRV